MKEQYILGYALVAAFVVLGLLIVCVPRPRKIPYRSVEEEEKADMARKKAKNTKKKGGKKKKKR